MRSGVIRPFMWPMVDFGFLNQKWFGVAAAAAAAIDARPRHVTVSGINDLKNPI